MITCGGAGRGGEVRKEQVLVVEKLAFWSEQLVWMLVVIRHRKLERKIKLEGKYLNSLLDYISCAHKRVTHLCLISS